MHLYFEAFLKQPMHQQPSYLTFCLCMHFTSQFEYLQSWTSHVLYFIPDNLYLTRYTLSMRAVQVTIFSWQANFDSSTVTHYHFHQRYTKREKLGQFLSDESLVCLTNQSWWVYAHRLVKGPSSPPFYNHLRQLLLWCIGYAVYFYCYACQSVASSLRQCVGREGGSSFTMMAARTNKGILQDPHHCLKCTSAMYTE